MLAITLLVANELAAVAEDVLSTSSFAFNFCDASARRDFFWLSSHSRMVVARNILSKAVRVSLIIIRLFSFGMFEKVQVYGVYQGSIVGVSIIFRKNFRDTE
jgi:hypothetical protein